MNQSTTACPHCGAEIDAHAKFCRHCGSSDSDGWRDESESWDDDEFDYDEYVEREHGTSVANTETKAIWRLVAIVLLVLMTGVFLISML